MAWWLLAGVASALAGDCETIRFPDLVDIEPPAVIVLGERHGVRRDLGRATRVVRVLASQAPVRVALEAVHRRFQPVLDRYGADTLEVGDLPALLDWEDSWGFAWRPYAPLVTAADLVDVEVVGAGLDLGPKPDDVEIPLPPRYVDILRPAMGDHPIPLGMEARFVQAMAWRDHGIAAAAVEGWDARGYLVIVTGRGHVEGGKGVAWQVAQMVDVPVHSAVLAWGGDPPCHPGDRIWR